ncbi:MAG: universal stress protein, partial [Acidobacteria bacterium]|nr:universal stress protein [Acidobacteriota bacterium]
VLVIKRLPAKATATNGNGNGNRAEADGRDTILVGVDGSPQSFGALMTAIDLAKTFGKKVEAISVYDPYLHYSVFKGVVNVLTERAAKIFRFEEQNQLHEEIIDTGLAQIYQSHLDVAETMATEVGVELTKTLLDGKAFQKVLDHARKIDPWMLVIGRVGVHSDEGESGLGSNAENLLRSCPCAGSSTRNSTSRQRRASAGRPRPRNASSACPTRSAASPAPPSTAWRSSRATA